MHVLDHGRQVKHLAFVARKRAGFARKRLKFDAATAIFRHASTIAPFVYRPERYGDTFLATDVKPLGQSELPRHVFAIWAGGNALTPNRQRNLELIERRLDLPVELVSPSTLDRWMVDGHPLHPAYAHLSLIHKSDYLRGYLMHHHGGAYVDIKEPLGSWADVFDRMADDDRAWVTSYTTTEANWIGKRRGRLGFDILVRYRLMFGKCAFIMRSHTPITAAWMSEMDAILDERYEALKRHPGGIFGDSHDYPMSWTDLLSRVLDPLTLKYHEHVRYDDRMLLRFEDYR